MTQQVTIKRTELPAPTLDKPERKIYQVEYRTGELPPRFLYMDVEGWTSEVEIAAIRADLAKRTEVKEETAEI